MVASDPLTSLQPLTSRVLGRARIPGVATLRMLTLATSTSRCSVSLRIERDDGGEVLEIASDDDSMMSGRVLELVDAVLRRAALLVGELDAIAFDAGPGAFTGLRIGCGVAQGLAFASARPVVAVGALQALALRAAITGQGRGVHHLQVALDARMGEVYFASYDLTDIDLARDDPAAICGFLEAVPVEVAGPAVAVERFAALQATRSTVWAIGDGFERYPALRDWGVAHAASVDVGATPDAAAIDALAALRWRAGLAVDAEHAAPLYVRDKVALTHAEQQLARQQRVARAGS